MSDDADKAQVIEAFGRDLAVRAVRANARHLSAPSAFGLCDDCADPIDAERRASAPGARRCLICQEAAERRLRLFAR